MKNVFANRNFRLVFFGALVSEVGSILLSFAVSFYILEITDKNAFIQGLYLALVGAVTLVLTPVGGVLGDRFNKARIMFLCDYVKGAAILLIGAMMLVFRSNGAHLAMLFAGGILSGAIAGIFSPASGALLPHILEEQQLQQANSYTSIRGSAQSIFGVVLAGVLYAALPVTTIFFLVGGCYIASGFSEMFIRYEHVRPEQKLTVRVAFRDMKDGLVYVRDHRALLAFMLAILFINFFSSPIFGNFMPYFIKTDVGGAESYLFDKLLTPELWLSVFEVLVCLSSLVAAAILSARKPAEKCGRAVSVRIAFMALLIIASTVCYWALVQRGVSLNAFLVMLSAGSLALGAILALVNIPISTAVMRMVDKNKLSKVSSITSITSQGLVPIASVLAGAILQSIGSTALLAFCALGFAAAAAYLLLNKKVREI